MKTSIIVQSWLLAIASGLCVSCVDELENEEIDEDLDEITQFRSSPVASTGTGYHMNTPAGTKVVVGPGNRLHAVYVDSSRLKYTTSLDGLVWTAPVNIGDTTAVLPTIAVADDGTIGVAYLRVYGPDSEIHYLSKPPFGAWSPSFKISSSAHSGPGSAGYPLQVTTPSLVAFGNTMHLAWAWMKDVFYIGFPANQSVTLGAAEEVDQNPPSCYAPAYFLNQPAIAVSRRSASDPSPRVRIAFFDLYEQDCYSARTFSITVSERAQNGSTWQDVNALTFPYPNGQSANIGGVSMSHAAIPGTGDFYVATSYFVEGLETTELWYENAWNTDTWRRTTLLPDRSIVDVTAQIVDCAPRLRYAISDYTQGANGYGPTAYRTGRWTGAQAATPTWTDDAPIQIHNSGRNAEALFYSKSITTSIRLVPAVFEQRTGNTTSIVEETTTVPGAVVQVPCSKQPLPPF